MLVDGGDVPTYVLSVPGRLDCESQDRLRKQWVEANPGTKAIVLTGGVTVERLDAKKPSKPIPQPGRAEAYRAVFGAGMLTLDSVRRMEGFWCPWLTKLAFTIAAMYVAAGAIWVGRWW